MSDIAATGARRIEKPWGYELIWAETERYVGKILHIRAGEALSLQYHVIKDETLYLLRGRLQLEAGDGEGPLRVFELRIGEIFRVPPGRRHRLTAIEDCDVLEASTPEIHDIVRLEDRYGRIGGG
jgi:mannose-6-phosphate isomerase-like protein (cupin superfamily)